jgi:zinc protease
LKKMQAALLAEVEKIATGGVTRAELAKARNQISTGRLKGLQTVNGLASALGMSTYVRGDPRAFLKDVALLDKVTSADIKRVAAAYLKRSNLSLLRLGEAKKGAAAKGAPAKKGGAK